MTCTAHGSACNLMRDHYSDHDKWMQFDPNGLDDLTIEVMRTWFNFLANATRSEIDAYLTSDLSGRVAMVQQVGERAAVQA